MRTVLAGLAVAALLTACTASPSTAPVTGHNTCSTPSNSPASCGAATSAAPVTQPLPVTKGTVLTFNCSIDTGAIPSYNPDARYTWPVLTITAPPGPAVATNGVTVIYFSSGGGETGSGLLQTPALIAGGNSVTVSGAASEIPVTAPPGTTSCQEESWAA